MKFGKTLAELAGELERQRTAKCDYLIDTQMLTMDADENGAMLSMQSPRTGEVQILGVNEVAHNQIGQSLGIPSKYYDKMRKENPQLLAENVNAWFSTDPKRRMVRTLDGTARAFLSDSYRRIDNFQIAETVLPIIAEIDGAKVESCEITDERMYIKVVNPRLEREVSVGDAVQSGIMITNSEVGLGSMTIQPLIYRLVCTNGMIVPDSRLRKYHAGRRVEAGDDYTIYSDETLLADDKALMLKVRDTVRSVVDEVRFERLIDMMKSAKEAKITTTNIPQMVELASSDFGYTKQEGQGILDYLIRGNDLSLYGFGNAITRFAQDVESYDRSTTLETIGYNVMTMPSRKWNALQKADEMAS